MEILENGYTAVETRLIEQFGFGNLMSFVDIPHTLYRMCVEKAFCENLQGAHVEALRRVYVALQECTTYRHTEAFDKLATF